ncbi:MAG: DUF413 domain-containing protein [Thalassotalea sp.]
MTTKDLSRESFQTSRKFYDDKNYPRGMRRSGDYSISEVNILETYGVALASLAAGTIEPLTDEEINFKSVCNGEITPTTAIEKAWLKYQNKILTPKQFHTLFGRSKVDTSTADSDTEDDDSVLDIDD